jgi:8-oxo-dGTP diphosphatase
MNSIQTHKQVSAGGVAFRRKVDRVEVALISVGEPPRWQLPKGLVGKDEDHQTTALREVREEAGLVTEVIELIDKIEYWYYSTIRGRRVRFHKYVYFYLLRTLSGDVHDHDHEVHEAAWFDIGEAVEKLAFNNEKKLVEMARQMIEGV